MCGFVAIELSAPVQLVCRALPEISQRQKRGLVLDVGLAGQRRTLGHEAHQYTRQALLQSHLLPGRASQRPSHLDFVLDVRLLDRLRSAVRPAIRSGRS